MATKSKLALAIEKQAGELNEAQMELVLAQFSTYDWNRSRIRELEGLLNIVDKRMPDDPKELKAALAKRKAYTAERNQLVTANNSISSKLFMQLKNTGVDVDELDEFFAKG